MEDQIPGWMFVAAAKLAHEVKMVSDGEIELDETALAAQLYEEYLDYEEFFNPDDDPDGNSNVVPFRRPQLGGLLPTPEAVPAAVAVPPATPCVVGLTADEDVYHNGQ